MPKRIQFDISDDLWERMCHYIKKEKNRHEYGHIALEEWINRREGRDKKLRAEKLLQDRDILRPIVQGMIDDGELNFNEN